MTGTIGLTKLKDPQFHGAQISIEMMERAIEKLNSMQDQYIHPGTFSEEECLEINKRIDEERRGQKIADQVLKMLNRK